MAFICQEKQSQALLALCANRLLVQQSLAYSMFVEHVYLVHNTIRDLCSKPYSLEAGCFEDEEERQRLEESKGEYSLRVKNMARRVLRILKWTEEKVDIYIHMFVNLLSITLSFQRRGIKNLPLI